MTPTAYRTMTPVSTSTPFPTSTPYAHTLPVTNPVIVFDTAIVTVTSRMTSSFAFAYSVIPSLTIAVSDTAIALPVRLVRGVATALPFWAGVFGVALAILLVRLVVAALVAVRRQGGGAAHGVSNILEQARGVLDEVPAPVRWAILLLPIILYTCNVVF